MKLWLFLFATLCLCIPITTAQAKFIQFSYRTHLKGARVYYDQQQFTKVINRIIKSHNKSAEVSVYIKSLNTGEAVYKRNIYLPMIPASTLKIFTAEAALLFLGTDYRFSTQLLTDAKSIRNGVLQGNLYIVLTGDPTLTFNDLVNLLMTLKTKHISAIAGNVYIDHFAYDQQFFGPGWDIKDRRYCYSAPISASIINHNCLIFKITPGKKIGRNAAVITANNYYYPNIKSLVMTKNAKAKTCSLHLTTLPANVIQVDGCMPKGPYAWGVAYVINNVSAYNKDLFKNLLRQLSIQVSGLITFGQAPTQATFMAHHASKPLKSLIINMLKKSDNIIAGALFKKVGQLYNKQPGSWENASYAVSQILSKQAGVNMAGMRLLDGSGLSANNLTTSSQLMQTLYFAFHHYATNYEFISALPVAGVDGTLKNRMSNIARKVRAKTGTISGVVTLAGYAMSADREPFAFVIMINGHKNLTHQYRSMEDQIATAITHFHRGD